MNAEEELSSVIQILKNALKKKISSLLQIMHLDILPSGHCAFISNIRVSLVDALIVQIVYLMAFSFMLVKFIIACTIYFKVSFLIIIRSSMFTTYLIPLFIMGWWT